VHGKFKKTFSVRFGSFWDCGSGCGSKYFRLEMHQNDIFFIFKNFLGQDEVIETKN
jgi:hypothetical protein